MSRSTSCFFPQLVAGPIVRATDLLPQMQASRNFASVGFKFFLSAVSDRLFQKSGVSDNVAPTSRHVLCLVRQIRRGRCRRSRSFSTRCRFIATSQAIPTWRSRLPACSATTSRPNFNHPYLAPNLIDFWRRWHMSLSFWLRDYLYIPLGGNRGGAPVPSAQRYDHDAARRAVARCFVDLRRVGRPAWHRPDRLPMPGRGCVSAFCRDHRPHYSVTATS